jgi:two-component system sensor histidine kinase/response regulator
MSEPLAAELVRDRESRQVDPQIKPVSAGTQAGDTAIHFAANRACRILVVDDDHLDQLAVRSELSRDIPGCEVVTASSVAEARTILSSDTFSVALVDFYLGDGLGTQLINVNPSVPVVVMTGAGNETSAVEAMQAGAYDYVVKDPQSGYLKALSATIAHVLARKDAERTAKQRTSELARAYRELEQFAYVVSHDLQAPLRSIKGFIGILKEDALPSLDDSAQDCLKRIDASASRMDALIRDLLDYSRVGRTGDEIEPVHTQQIISHLRGDLEATMLASDAELVVETELPWVEGVPVRLRQLFQNLVGNALKFRGDDPPRVRVGITTGERGREFYVADNGIGIDSDHFESIFRVFSRVGHADEFEGTGIGLSICKKIVEQHGGAIRLESKLGQGTTFFFSLAICAPPRP